jgi:hypothetical protein
MIRPSTQELRNQLKAHQPLKEKPSTGLLLLLFVITFSISTYSFAGSSQPQLKGKNGNANGR